MQDVQNVFPFLINKIRNMKLYVQLETDITNIQCFLKPDVNSAKTKSKKKKKKKDSKLACFYECSLMKVLLTLHTNVFIY